MECYFKDKTVLVTGAGWGIGAAAAFLYAACGANVVVSDISREGSEDVTYINTDVRNAAACEKLIKKTIETYGSIDIACNNSAIFNEPSHNLDSLNNCMHYEIDAMQKHGGGVIVNTSSMVGVIGSTSLSRCVDAPIRINTIAPSIIKNAFLKDMVQRERDWKRKLFPFEGHGAIHEVARLVLWLSKIVY